MARSPTGVCHLMGDRARFRYFENIFDPRHHYFLIIDRWCKKVGLQHCRSRWRDRKTFKLTVVQAVGNRDGT
ncbi:hypothetical protein IQ235_07625 [Oscillatoriales cyanobacterium LEGE 11467]|uniref:Uncharacterized protein n=1 Tax=Zarconia navalis LEGE 11467 TaxID=1828826 RepID=A0A928VYT6_9CYAN|nr:hypothetical protein [Zarconia navalis]MBE9040648.1 hypothetical protein [Zarconia navalis LEGE 11467]